MVQVFLTTNGESRTWGSGAAHYANGVDVALHGKLCWRHGDKWIEEINQRVCGYFVLVDLTAQALDELRSQGKSDQAIAAFLDGEGFEGTRVDATFDSRDKKMSPSVIRDYIARGHFTTTAKPDFHSGRHEYKPYVRGVVRTPEQASGEYLNAIYFPLRERSERRFRVYDKVFEKQSKGEHLLDDDGSIIDHCTRFELVNRADSAKAVLRAVAQRGLEGVAEAWATFIQFKDPRSAGRCRHKKNAKLARFYREMVEGAKRLKVSGVRGVSTPEKKMDYALRVLAPQMAFHEQAGTASAIFAQAARIKDKIDRAKIQEMKKFREKSGPLVDASERRDLFGDVVPSACPGVPALVSRLLPKKEKAEKSVVVPFHEDLAKMLQDRAHRWNCSVSQVARYLVARPLASNEGGYHVRNG